MFFFFFFTGTPSVCAHRSDSESAESPVHARRRLVRVPIAFTPVTVFSRLIDYTPSGPAIRAHRDTGDTITTPKRRPSVAGPGARRGAPAAIFIRAGPRVNRTVLRTKRAVPLIIKTVYDRVSVPASRFVLCLYSFDNPGFFYGYVSGSSGGYRRAGIRLR